MMDLVDLIIYLLLGGLVIYVVYWILGMLALPEQIKKVVMVVVAVSGLLWLLQTFGII